MYSKSTQRILKQYNLTPQELTFCLVYLAKYNLTDSYLLSFQPMSNKITNVMTKAKRLSEQPNIKAFIAERNGVVAPEQTEEVEQTELTENEIDEVGSIPDKSQMIKSLTILIQKTTDTKLKSELIMKLADLSGVRKEQIETDDNKIYYYLPITCNVCPKNQ